jgi:hypothetical protein
MAPPHRRRFPGGRYQDHLSKDNGRKVKSPLGKTANFAQELERAKGIEPSTYSLGSCRSTTELRPRFTSIAKPRYQQQGDGQTAGLSVAAELPPQLALGAFQGLAPGGRQVLAGAINIEGQHRQRGAVRIGLAPAAAFRRTF